MTVGITTKKCHRPGCGETKRYGRPYLYCSDDCARSVALAEKRIASAHWRDGHRNSTRIQFLWTRYRLTQEMFDARLESQGGCCAICGAASPGGTPGSAWHVDHDHACCNTKNRNCCGECTRGLLCKRCNQQLLPQIESPLLSAALAYVEKWRR